MQQVLLVTQNKSVVTVMVSLAQRLLSHKLVQLQGDKIKPLI